MGMEPESQTGDCLGLWNPQRWTSCRVVGPEGESAEREVARLEFLCLWAF